jgi:hypothetical protein
LGGIAGGLISGGKGGNGELNDTPPVPQDAKAPKKEANKETHETTPAATQTPTAPKSSVTLEHAIGRLTDQLAQLSGTDMNAILGIGLKQPSALPGWHNKLNPNQADQARSSSLTLVERIKGSTEAWKPVCTTTKIGASLGMAARHCITYSFENNAGEPVINIVNATPNEYAVANIPSDQSEAASLNPIARVTGISIYSQSVSQKGRSDMALLKLKPLAATGASRSYKSVPALDLKATVKPTPGEAVATYTLPSSTSQVGVSAVGHYLGEVQYGRDASGHSLTVDAVGFTVKDAHRDPTEYGGSGGNAITASGYTLGPGLARTGKPAEVNQPSQESKDTYPDRLGDRIDIEQALGLDLGRFTVIATYTKRPDGSIDQLTKGFRFKVAATTG